MNPDQVKKATRLIARRGELQNQLKRLGQTGGFPCSVLEYMTNAGIGVVVSISKEMQQSIETLLHTILSSQIKQVEIELSILGVECE